MAIMSYVGKGIMLQISHKMFRNMIFGYHYFDRFDAVRIYTLVQLLLLVLAVRIYTLIQLYFYTARSKAVLLLWFLTVTCSCCPYLYFGSAIFLY